LFTPELVRGAQVLFYGDLGVKRHISTRAAQPFDQELHDLLLMGGDDAEARPLFLDYRVLEQLP
jgi:hypothetical protein